jgi:hypothetical protein
LKRLPLFGYTNIRSVTGLTWLALVWIQEAEDHLATRD